MRTIKEKHKKQYCTLAIIATGVTLMVTALADTILVNQDWTQFWTWFWGIVSVTAFLLVVNEGLFRNLEHGKE